MNATTAKITKITEIRQSAEGFYPNPALSQSYEWISMRVQLDNGQFFFTPMEHLLLFTSGVRAGNVAVSNCHASLYYEKTQWWTLGETRITTNEDLNLTMNTTPYSPTIAVGDVITVKGTVNGQKLSRVKLVR